MDKILLELLTANEEVIKNSFDYLFVYVIEYVRSCFPQPTGSQKICSPKFVFIFFAGSY